VVTHLAATVIRYEALNMAPPLGAGVTRMAWFAAMAWSDCLDVRQELFHGLGVLCLVMCGPSLVELCADTLPMW